MDRKLFIGKLQTIQSREADIDYFVIGTDEKQKVQLIGYVRS